MSTASLEVVRCPAALCTEALALVLCDLAPSQRREVADLLLQSTGDTDLAREPLLIALRNGQLCGAAWGQRQPGNVAVFWPPRLVADENEQTAIMLAEAVVGDLDDAAVNLAQSLLVSPDAATIQVLQQVGFRHLADLLYLSCESAHFPPSLPSYDIEFEEYQSSQHGRMQQLIERTYEGTLDCTALDGVRDMEDVMNGYQATGVYCPSNWLFVRSGGADVGVLLLADHPCAHHWELMYMGLVPEARGRGWGRQMAQHAQWLARRNGAERLLAAVDAANSPAEAVYRRTGFESWERRVVYLRFREQLRS